MGKKATCRRQNSSCLQHGQGVETNGSDSETQNALTSSQGRTNTLGGMLLQHVCSDKWKSFLKVFVSMTELPTTTCLTNSDWFDFMQRVAGTKCYHEDQDFHKNFPVYMKQLVAATCHRKLNWGSDLSSLCVALTCQLVCSDLTPMTAYCEFRALNTLQCYLMSLYCSHDYYMKPTYVIKVNWYPTKRQNQIQMECFREFQYL